MDNKVPNKSQKNYFWLNIVCRGVSTPPFLKVPPFLRTPPFLKNAVPPGFSSLSTSLTRNIYFVTEKSVQYAIKMLQFHGTGCLLNWIMLLLLKNSSPQAKILKNGHLDWLKCSLQAKNYLTPPFLFQPPLSWEPLPFYWKFLYPSLFRNFIIIIIIYRIFQQDKHFKNKLQFCYQRVSY